MQAIQVECKGGGIDARVQGKTSLFLLYTYS